MKRIGVAAMMFGGLLANAYSGEFTIKESGSFTISAADAVGMRQQLYFEDSAVVVNSSEVLLLGGGKTEATRLPLKDAQVAKFGEGFVTVAEGTVIARDRFGKELKSWPGTQLIANRLRGASQDVLGILNVENDKSRVTLVKEKDFSADSFTLAEPVKDSCLLLSADKKCLLAYSIPGIVELGSTITEMSILRDGKPKVDLGAKYRGSQMLGVSTTGHLYLTIHRAPKTTVYCVDAAGAEIWNKEIDSFKPIFEVAGSDADGDRVLLATSDKAFEQTPGKMRLLLLDPQGKTIADLSEGSFNAPQVAPDQSCVILTGKGEIMGADLKSGKLLWRKPTKETFDLDLRGALAVGTATIDGAPVYVWLWHNSLPDGKFGDEIKIIVVNIATGEKTAFSECDGPGVADSGGVDLRRLDRGVFGFVIVGR